jgi:hypothetical protein
MYSNRKKVFDILNTKFQIIIIKILKEYLVQIIDYLQNNVHLQSRQASSVNEHI